MGIFKSKAEKELDSIIHRLEMNMSNNYKDNAQDDLKDLEATINVLGSSGGIKPGVLAKYERLMLTSHSFADCVRLSDSR